MNEVLAIQFTDPLSLDDFVYTFLIAAAVIIWRVSRKNKEEDK